ncbi:pectinesterase family protein [Niastella sp. OAS944]|uniref:pectinesterase family protein n=1 Tax=Niastella sp. OAS944 TaxID=2664089 RepID=UPI003481247B|nr:pectin methylesterase-like acyl-CoA thioesterase/acetyl esterase/lipase [Chitinophagaceae bacterium OAS944]
MVLKRLGFLIPIIIGFTIANAQTKEIPRDTTYNVNTVYNQIHKDYPMAVAAKDAVPKGVKADRNVVYTTLENTPYGKRELHLDIFRPEKAGKHPAIVMVHGGGWRSGTRQMQVPMAQMLAVKGFVTIPVEYQLSQEAKYPAAVYNIKSAIRWIKLNADKYGIDTSRIAVSGCSAGGQLAAFIGLTNGVAQFEGDLGNKGASSKVHAVIDIDGVIDFMAPLSLNLKRKPNSPDSEWLGGSFEEKPLIWKEASPIFWATESMVPVLFVNSGYNWFHAGRDELTGMMKDWKKYYEVHGFDIKVHPFWLFHPWVDTTVDYMHNFLSKIFTTTAQARKIVVASDGSGDFKTVQQAIDAVKDSNTFVTTIYIKNGIYKEKLNLPASKRNIHFIGESVEKTVLTFDDYASKKDASGKNIGTSGSASFYIYGSDISAENITFENAAGPVGQAVAVRVTGDRIKFINCRFLGFQDTLYTHGDNSRQYYLKCYIEGTVDFIFGASTCLFDSCVIYGKTNGFYTAASTPADKKFGYVFRHCNITGNAPASSFYLGRPWRPYAKVVFIESELSNMVKPEGWHNWDKAENEKTTYYAEYNNRGKGAVTSGRVPWSHVLSAEEAKDYTIENILSGWKP